MVKRTLDPGVTAAERFTVEARHPLRRGSAPPCSMIRPSTSAWRSGRSLIAHASATNGIAHCQVEVAVVAELPDPIRPDVVFDSAVNNVVSRLLLDQRPRLLGRRKLNIDLIEHLLDKSW